MSLTELEYRLSPRRRRGGLVHAAQMSNDEIREAHDRLAAEIRANNQRDHDPAAEMPALKAT